MKIYRLIKTWNDEWDYLNDQSSSIFFENLDNAIPVYYEWCEQAITEWDEWLKKQIRVWQGAPYPECTIKFSEDPNGLRHLSMYEPETSRCLNIDIEEIELQ